MRGRVWEVQKNKKRGGVPADEFIRIVLKTKKWEVHMEFKGLSSFR